MKAMRNKGSIPGEGGDDPNITPVILNLHFFQIAWAVICEIATEAVRRRSSTRWLPSSHDPEDISQRLCEKVLPHIQGPSASEAGATNVLPAICVESLAATIREPARTPRPLVGRIGETIRQCAVGSLGQPNENEAFEGQLRANKGLRDDIKQLTSDIIKATQDKDRGWTRSEQGKKVRRPCRSQLTAVDLAGLWDYKSPEDEAIRAEMIHGLIAAIARLKPLQRSVWDLTLDGLKPSEIAEKTGLDPKRVYNLKATACEALRRSLKGSGESARGDRYDA